MEDNGRSIVERARNFSYSKFAVREGERLSGEDVVGILMREFGDDAFAWLALARNPRLKWATDVHSKIARHCARVWIRALVKLLPAPHGKLKALLKRVSVR